MEGVSIGKVVLSQWGITRYKRENPWLSSLSFLPYILLYSEGSRWTISLLPRELTCWSESRVPLR